MCAAMVDRNPEYPDYGRPMYDSNPQNDYGRPAYESYQQPGDYRRGQEYGQERYNPTSQYPGSSDPPVKEEQANKHREEMVRQQHASPPHPANQTEMYDHNQMSQQLREERRKEYNDYLDDHKRLDLKSVEGDRMLGTPSKQQKEQILNRAQHQLEIPVIDRRQPNSDPPPPINPPQDRPPSGRWDPQSYRQSDFGQVKRVTSPPHQANIGHDDYGAFRRQTEHEVRNKEYNDFLAKKQNLEDEKKQKLAEKRRQAPAPIVKGDYYDSEQYDRRRQALNDLQHREYQNYLKNQPATPPEAYGLPIGQQHYIPKQKWMEKQRNMEYNQLLKKQHDQQRNRAPTPDHLQGLPLSQRQYDSMRKMQEKQRNQEYNDLLAKKGFNQHQPPETNRRPELGLKSEFQDQYQDPASLPTNRGKYSSELEQYSSRRDNQARLNFDSHVQIAPQAISSDQVRTNSGKLKYYGLMTETQEQYRNPVTKNLDKGPKTGKKQEADRFRKQENGRPDNRIGFMSHLGRPVEEMREKLAKERHEDYNKYLKDDNWQKEAAGSRSRPTSDKPIHTPTYEEMLDRKRKEEASYRRFDDPEYSRSGADRGYDAQYRRYDQ